MRFTTTKLIFYDEDSLRRLKMLYLEQASFYGKQNGYLEMRLTINFVSIVFRNYLRACVGFFIRSEYFRPVRLSHSDWYQDLYSHCGFYEPNDFNLLEEIPD